MSSEKEIRGGGRQLSPLGKDIYDLVYTLGTIAEQLNKEKKKK